MKKYLVISLFLFLFISCKDDDKINPINSRYAKWFKSQLDAKGPNIVLNKVDYSSIPIPSHWNLSQIHINNINKRKFS